MRGKKKKKKIKTRETSNWKGRMVGDGKREENKLGSTVTRNGRKGKKRKKNKEGRQVKGKK